MTIAKRERAIPLAMRKRRRGAGAIILRIALTIALLALAIWQFPEAVGASQPVARRRAPNLLLIVADDQSGLWLGAAGDTRGATPNLDALARQGVFFERTYCNSPLCTPSRQSFITGLLPHAVGVTRLETPLPSTALTLGQWLSVLGYRTAAIGKMHFNNRSRHGFDVRIDAPDWLVYLRDHPPTGGDHRRPWRPFADPPAEWLNARCRDAGVAAEDMESSYFVNQAIEYMNGNRDHPFVLVVSFYEPHAPFRFPREWLGRYRPRDFSVPPMSQQDRHEQPRVFRHLTEDDLRGIQAAYYTSLSFMDEQIGRLVRTLDEIGLGSSTLVVFLSDNGYLLGQHGRVEKNCFFEPAVRVPLILRWPGHLPAGKKHLEMVELVDLFPTLCTLLRVPTPRPLHGIDLVPWIEGKPGASGRQSVFSEYTENEEAMVRSDRYKLIVGSGRRARKDRLETGNPLSGPYQQLFDLERDPEETNDLADDPRFAAVAADLLHKMHERMVSTREGLEPVPSGLSPLETIYWCLTPRDK
jgi:choline-sulfatase